MPIIDFSRLDTTPGNGGPFCPPVGFSGSGEDYSRWLREKFTADPGIAQAMYVAWRFRVGAPGKSMSLGPYAGPIDTALLRFERWCKASTEE